GAADLARLPGDGVRRCAVAVGPAAAGRRPQAGEALGRRAAAGGAGVMRRAAALLLALSLLVPPGPALAVQPDESLSAPAPLARDRRLLVRDRLKAGDSDEAVIDFLTARYGEFVLLKPPFGWRTAALWMAPLALLLIGGLAVRAALRRRSAAVAEPALSEA